MTLKNRSHKHGSTNPLQKGTRRQRLHKNQNDVGNQKNKSQYEDFNGESIE